MTNGHKGDIETTTQERISLGEQIWASIDSESINLTSAQKKELDRRLDLDKSGDMPYYSWEDVKESIFNTK